MWCIVLAVEVIEWFGIPGYPDYFVNVKGEVLSRRQAKRGKLLKPVIDPKGYPKVMLYDRDGGKRLFKVHSVVALVFHGPRPDGLITRHLDGDQMNNVPENITYGTYSENQLDQVRHGTHPESRKTHCHRGHPLSGDNLRIDPKGVRRCKRCHADNIARYRARCRARL